MGSNRISAELKFQRKQQEIYERRIERVRTTAQKNLNEKLAEYVSTLEAINARITELEAQEDSAMAATG